MMLVPENCSRRVEEGEEVREGEKKRTEGREEEEKQEKEMVANAMNRGLIWKKTKENELIL